MSEQIHNEKEILFLVSEGDETAFRNIFQTYGDLIHANIYSVVKSQAAAKDLVQDTFLRVWLYRDKLPEIENFRAWLLRISYNRAFNFLRDVGTQQKKLDQYAVKYGNTIFHNKTEEDMQLHLLNNVIAKAVKALPPQQKKIYLLSREQGLKQQVIADQLGLSLSTIKNTLGKALEALREAVEKAGFGVWIILWPWLM